MTVENLKPLLESVKNIAQVAGEKILKIYGEEFSVDIKQDTSPLTAADLAAHVYITEELAKISDLPILSEESAQIDYSERQQWQTYWLVDPLDGTKEFIKRNGDFTVNIALIHGDKVVLGVVYVPVSGVYYFAAAGEGAFKQTGAGEVSVIQVRQSVPEKLTVVGSRSHITPELKQYLSRLPEHQLTSMGSSLKLCLVAEGVADLYPRIGLTSEWDTAAAQCVVEQAGGAVMDIKGNPLSYNQKESLLNPYFLVFADTQQDWLKYLCD